MLSFRFAAAVAVLAVTLLLAVHAHEAASCDYTTGKFQQLEKRLEELESRSRHIKCWSWPAMNNGIDEGLIKSVSFNKKRTDSKLHLTWTGNLRVNIPGGTTTEGCSRWFFTINNEECKYPQAVDAVMFQNYVGNSHMIGNIEGTCALPLAGIMPINFNVGKCAGYTAVTDAYTSWNSASTLCVEELFKQ